MDTKQIYWIEVTPIIHGGYCCGHSEDDAGRPIPYVYDTWLEAQDERIYMEKEWDRQIAAKEREEGDVWDGEIFPCRIVGDVVELLDEATIYNKTPFVIEAFNWKDGL
tara:strand:+ start:108 stop:431 length:324 start_codon:yes stop_codon:yes gene_type:complete